MNKRNENAELPCINCGKPTRRRIGSKPQFGQRKFEFKEKKPLCHKEVCRKKYENRCF